jgi:Outer membrane protein/protective antigen OMA87
MCAVSHQALFSMRRAVDEYTLPSQTISRDRTSARLAWQIATAKTYGYSISAEEGIAGGVTTELVRRSLGAFADSTTVAGDFRAYVPGIRDHHVLALRVAGGTSTGDAAAGRTFLLGGPGPDTLVADFGSSAISLLRGFGSNTFAGRHVALLNADYRFPIARPQRGLGTWPLFLHTVHGAIFADAGHAWTNSFDASSMKTSAGAELSAHIVFAYSFPLTATFGAAWGHDGSGRVPDGATAYFRIGRAF